MKRTIKRNILKNQMKTNKIRNAWQRMQVNNCIPKTEKGKKKKDAAAIQKALKTWLFEKFFPCNGRSKTITLGGI